ncbi:MAG: Gfo/Idh/MocA family oxidoreductase [Candidatus Kariarchaeaceae archaeon]
MEAITGIIIGTGDRGKTYGQFALDHPSQLKIVAAADPHKEKLENFRLDHEISTENCYSSWEDILLEDQIAETAIITTPDQMHVEPAITAMEQGYHVLLEKPMAITPEDCLKLVQKAEETNKILQVCHVMRYTHFYSSIHKLVKSGKIGELVNISLRENVSHYHYAHSFIRGNWNNRKQSSPMILAKCCHDLDFLYWVVDSDPCKISSFGSQIHFGQNNAPLDGPERCTDDCPVESTCLYSAPRLYLNIIPLLHATQKGGSRLEKIITKGGLNFPLLKKFPPFNRINQYNGWPVSVITEDLTEEGKLRALREGPYGKCVYKIPDHDVVDHQVVNIEFDNQVTANLTMHGHAHEEGRTIRVDGTRGTLIGEFLLSGQQLILFDSLSGTKKVIQKTGLQDGHGGGDPLLMEAFVEAVKTKQKDASYLPLTGARASLMSHLMAFAADKSRLEGSIINPLDYLEK